MNDFDADQSLTALLERAEEAIQESRQLVAAAQAERVVAYQQLRCRCHILQRFKIASRIFYPSDTVDMRLRGGSA